MRIAALPRLSFNRLPAVFRGKGVRLRSLRAIGTRLNGVLGFETTVINHLCMSVLLVLVAQCTYAGLSAGEYALTVKPGFMGIDGLPNSYMTPVPSSTYASSCPGW
jgi:hypothetical protein